MKTHSFALVFVLLIASLANPNDLPIDSPKSDPVVQETDRPVEMRVPKRTAFQKELVKAVRAQRKAKNLSAAQAIRLRVAITSPAFAKRAEDLAVIQMAFSDDVPRTETGAIDRAGINWEGLAKFLQALLPLLLQLLEGV